MVLQLMAVILVLAIAFYQVVQGLFSAMIMMILTILCAAVAFEYYEPVAVAFLYERQGAYAEGASLLALFVIPLLLLRIAFDKLIGGNVVMGLWVDRIGGWAVGIVTALVLVGVLCTVVVMLPFGESILGYTSHNSQLEEDQTLVPMTFTLGLVDALSKLGLGGGTAYLDRHPDLLLDAFCARNTAGKNGRRDTPTNALKVIGVFEPKVGGLNDDIPKSRPDPTAAESRPAPKKLVMPSYPLLEDPEQKTVIVRVSVSDKARSEDEKDNWWRLPGTHFRLVSKTSRSYYPVGYLTALSVEAIRARKAPEPEEADWRCHLPPKDESGQTLLADLIVERKWYREGGPDNLVIDWVYSIGKDEKVDRIVFRRVAIETVAEDKLTPGWPKTKPAPAEGVFRLPPKKK